MKSFSTNAKSATAITSVAIAVVLSAGTAQAVASGNIEVCGTNEARITVKFLDRGGMSVIPTAK
ncbi:hypothetical protein C8D88_12813 [Lentzea atacamensis]|uniref:Uncharacterized protein n=1 Tax=Lentzea atacamensis TaxID=531938 RepID=A0A316HEU4_9PSEU|nr:hypothetical protein [Lentzea atacamensis]PWK78551.1 hypothetical protein C8D88_12813 [Lentzea atacamensis]